MNNFPKNEQIFVKVNNFGKMNNFLKNEQMCKMTILKKNDNIEKMNNFFNVLRSL